MNITINNEDNHPVDQKVLQAALARCASFSLESTVIIQIAARNPMDWPEHRNPGMMVYKMRVNTPGETKYSEIVSRKPHLSVEYHA
jgi:hypothetical protein